MGKGYIKLSDFLKLQIKPFLYGAFMSRIMVAEKDGESYFYTYSKFKSSKYVYKSDFDIKGYAGTYINKLNYLSGHYNWILHKATESSLDVRFYILNDLSFTKLQFYTMLHRKLVAEEFIYDEGLNEGKKDFIRGFIELRGSVDTSARFISQDYYYESAAELKKALILTDMMNLPLNYANFNMRNLQPQFVSGESQRNTQFRINLFYYVLNIGFVNDYKAKVFENAYSQNGRKEVNGIIYYGVELSAPKDDDVTFIKMINFFTNNIYKKQLTEEAVEDLRKKLGLSNESTDEPRRNMSLVKLFNEISPDECALCGTKTTYTNPSTGRQQFEIHHMISFKNGVALDNMANFVKLCPTCHGLLGKGSATKEQQMQAIIKILYEHQEIFEFTSNYLAIEDINELSEKIWQMLG